MTEKSIDIGASLQFGWNTLRDNFVFFIKLLLVLIAISILPTMLIGRLAVKVGPYLGIPLQFLNLVWQSILAMGVLKIALKLYDRQPVDLRDLGSCVGKTLDYIVVKFLYALIVAGGLILLIVPGIIWGLQFYFGGYLVVDKGMGFMDALRGSSALTRGAKWSLFAFTLVVLVINFLGALLFGIGLLITLPVTVLAGVYVYRNLSPASGVQ